jgi:hypothetical protein
MSQESRETLEKNKIKTKSQDKKKKKGAGQGECDLTRRSRVQMVNLVVRMAFC